MTRRAPPLFADFDVALGPGAGHLLVAANSGSGKTTGILLPIAHRKLADPLTGFIAIDPEGEISRYCADVCANPENGLGWRNVHYLQPSSKTHAFALPILHVPDRSPQKCHDQAVRALTIFEQAVTVGAGDYGPRLSKFFYMGCVGLALSGRAMCELPDLYGRGAQHLRDIIGNSFPYPFLTDEWRSLDLLSDRAFLEYRDPLISRLLPIFGNEQLRRVFGPQHPPLDIAAILRNREGAFLDLSNLESKVAVLVGKAFLSCVYHQALQREPNREPHMHVMLDEAFDFLTPDLARSFDRLRKRNVQLCVAVQRFAQLKKAADDDSAAILSAVVSGTPTKFIGQLPEPDDADLMTNVLFRGFVDLQTWKEASARPTAVGNEKVIVRGTSDSEQTAEHHMQGYTRMSGYAHAHGTFLSEGDGSGRGEGSGDVASQLSTPPLTLFGPNAPNASMIPVVLSQTSGTNVARNEFSQSSRSSGSSSAEIYSEGEASTVARGSSRGRSHTTNANESYITKYQGLPTQMYSLPERLHQLAGEIQNLARREFFVKVHNQRPVRVRTVDLKPPFKSDYFRRIMLPIFHGKMCGRSPYVLPAAEADALIAKRQHAEAPLIKNAVVGQPEPLPASLVDAPASYAQKFWQRILSRPDSPPPKPKKPKPGRKPVGRLDGRHDRFRVVPGGKDDGDKPE